MGVPHPDRPVAALDINGLCVQFELEWRSGHRPRLEDYLSRVGAEHRHDSLRQLLVIELHYRRDLDEQPLATEYAQRLPQFVEAIQSVLGAHSPQSAYDSTISPKSDQIPHFAYDSTIVPAMSGGAASSSIASGVAPTLPRRLGRYELLAQIGEGGFGRVFRAHDTQLDRVVAIKIPSERLCTEGFHIEKVLAEAQTAAKLKHPGLVPVYDVQLAGQWPYIVQELIDGPHLEQWASSAQPTHEQIVKVLIDVAEGVSYAHQQGFVHRDLKPTNILIDDAGRARVADFGLAIHESVQSKRAGEVSGTPAYMSPEQVRGETHRLDGRTDIWSLGVMLYELTLHRRPFRGATTDELFEAIVSIDPRPPRQLDRRFPRELERICLKCLAKKQVDRYTSAADLAEDLRYCLDVWNAPIGSPSAAGIPETQQRMDGHRVIPKGLRSFDEHDADFFLELLPGPRDRYGLPDSVRFWKTRIEERDADKTFAVGLIYGPSGCGKSSIVRAGIVPHLAPHIAVTYVEASEANTEDRLVKRLYRLYPDLPPALELPELIYLLRDRYVSNGNKVLLVLDQFEQWLYSHAGENDTQLMAALRHCDGERVQCVIIVRDDFWLAVSRFLGLLEVPIVEGHNSALVDLFGASHGRTVLETFGRAFGQLPPEPTPLDAPHNVFLDRAIKGLSEQGKIVPVRLALFAELVKVRSWTPAALTEIGGADGVGCTFLEETFAGATAAPPHRLHRNAAQRLLQSLLPPEGSDIKGHSRLREELSEVAGYKSRPKDFEELLHILDAELRLITPKDPEILLVDDTIARAELSRRTYQLTHDYLVPSICQWLYKAEMKSYFGRLRTWCRQQQRISDASVAAILICIVVLGLQFGGVVYWVWEGQWAKRPTEWAIQWSVVNACCVTGIALQYMSRRYLSIVLSIALFGICALYFLAIVAGFLPEALIAKFGGLYDIAEQRWIPFLLYFTMLAAGCALNCAALVALRHRTRGASLGGH